MTGWGSVEVGGAGHMLLGGWEGARRLRPLALGVMTLGLSAAVGLTAVLRPQVLWAGVAAVALAAVVRAGGPWVLGTIFVGFGALGTGLDSGLVFAGAHVPMVYLMLTGLTLATAFMAVADSTVGQRAAALFGVGW
jgi:hypothetical protein